MDHKNPLKMIDPLTGMEMTMQPPMTANQMGTAQPVFNQNASNAASIMYGTPLQRQMSMGAQAPVFFTDQTGDGEITQADVIKARTEGYEESPNNMSPLNQKQNGDKKMLKTLTDKPKVTTAYNSSYTGNPDVSNRIYNAATGLSINEDPTYNYKKASLYEANAIRQYGSLEAARKALYNKRNK
jgi:hypothetical protein